MRLYQPDEAVKLARKLLKDRGFFLIQASDTGSHYLIKGRTKVRISNHNRSNTDDCDFNIIFTEVTILPDIEYRVSKCSSSK